MRKYLLDKFIERDEEFKLTIKQSGSVEELVLKLIREQTNGK